MKMILAVMPTNLSEEVSARLIENDFRVTKFASTAGLLSGGVTTLMIVAQSDQIERSLEIIRGSVPPTESGEDKPARVTLYVLAVKDFARV